MNDDLEKRFGYKRPGVTQIRKMETLRAATSALAELIDELVPDCREKSLAFTHLEQVGHWARQGIAIRE